MMSAQKDVLLKVTSLTKHFNIGKDKVVRAVDDVSFTIHRGETLGLVGESGCGKTTCGRTLLHLYNPTSGTVDFDGKPVGNASKREQLAFKRRAQTIFQDPYSALDPRMTIGEIVAEGLEVHHRGKKRSERNALVTDLLLQIGLTSDYAGRFPHELSGGQRQRVGIARALAVSPDFIVCDEPISALDVSIQAQIVNLLIKLQAERGLTYLFISHDLSMVKHISDRVGVMYLGNIVELAESNELFENALHPYTKALISAIPTADPDFEAERKRIPIEGEVPSPINPPSGCKFHTRCPLAGDKCKSDAPIFEEKQPGHFVACHHV